MPKQLQAPRPARLRGFPKLPRLPYPLAPPGETQADQVEAEFLSMKAQYPALTRPEFLVFRWLTLHFGEGSEGSDWGFQVPLLGGREIAGGSVADFVIYDAGFGRGQVWRTSDEHFHYFDPAAQADYILEKEWLENEGWEVIDLLGAHLEQDVNYVCSEALKGNQLFVDPQGGGMLAPRTMET